MGTHAKVSTVVPVPKYICISVLKYGKLQLYTQIVDYETTIVAVINSFCAPNSRLKSCPNPRIILLFCCENPFFCNADSDLLISKVIQVETRPKCSTDSLMIETCTSAPFFLIAKETIFHAAHRENLSLSLQKSVSMT